MRRPVIRLTRRQVLAGAGGFTLALPLLPSLLVDTAYGADPVFVRRPRLYWLTSNHGGALETNMFPPQAADATTQTVFADHSVRASELRATVAATNAVISPVLQADVLALPGRMLRQLNVIRGLDIPFGIAHHTGGHLGNYARNDTLVGEGFEAQSHPRPTIDQLLAWSPAFYDDLDAVRERALVLGPRTISWNYSSPTRGEGTIENVRGSESSRELFQRVFVARQDSAAASVPVVDRVLESYRRLRDGNRRLSAADRQRLDDHMERVAELQRKLGAGGASTCGAAGAPTEDALDHGGSDPSDAAREAELWNEVIAAAFICGTSRIAVFGLGDDQRFAGYTGDWHNDVAHQWLGPDKQALIVRAYQGIFERVFLDLARRLDVEEAPGMTYLDNSLLVWTQESGMSSHDPVSLPVVTAGAAGGCIQTGLSLDYRRLGDPASRFDPQADGYLMYAGMLYNQFLATVLQAMGLRRPDFERWGHRGYGYPVVSAPGAGILPFATHYENTSSRYFEIASDPLPFLMR